MIKIALRNIFRNKFRSILTLSIIVFGCVSLIFTVGFFENLYFMVREANINSNSGHIQLHTKGYSKKGTGDPYDSLLSNWEPIQEKVQAIDGVKTVTPRVHFSGLLSTGEKSLSFIGMGVVPEDFNVVLKTELQTKRDLRNVYLKGLYIEEGRYLSSARPHEIVLGKGLAGKLGASVGDEYILLTKTLDDSINGIEVRVAGLFKSGTKEFDDYFAQIPFETAQRLVRTEGTHSLVVFLDKTRATQKYKTRIDNSLNAEKEIVEFETWEEMNEFYQKTILLFDRWVLIVKFIISLIVILAIFNTMNMAISERTVEIGTLMAMGHNRKEIVALFMTEGLLLGLVGGGLGLLAGSLLTWITGAIGIPMPIGPGFSLPWVSQPSVVPSGLLHAFLIAVGASLVSSLPPSLRASKLEIAQALRYVG